MTCQSCGHENREGAKFCGACAASLAGDPVCSSCGARNPAGQKFCDECGAEIRLLVVTVLGVRGNTDSLTANSLTASSLSPRAYTPKHLADKILTSRSALEGERKQVTVLFADVKGSMELSGVRAEPEQRAVRSPGDSYFAAVGQAGPAAASRIQLRTLSMSRGTE